MFVSFGDLYFTNSIWVHPKGFSFLPFFLRQDWLSQNFARSISVESNLHEVRQQEAQPSGWERDRQGEKPEMLYRLYREGMAKRIWKVPQGLENDRLGVEVLYNYIHNTGQHHFCRSMMCHWQGHQCGCEKGPAEVRARKVPGGLSGDEEAFRGSQGLMPKSENPS